MSPSRALIFANGLLPDKEKARSLVHPRDVLIAADGGTRHILSMGLIPAVIIGDLDSLPENSLEKLGDPPPLILRHSRDKEETDLELALRYTLEQGFDPIILIAALGGRLDQTLGNLSLLTSPELTGRDIRLDDGQEEVLFTRNQADWRGNPGDTLSLLPWGAPVIGVSTRGLKWQLNGETLEADNTRGISNEMLGESASVQIKSGLLLIIHSRRLLTG